MFILYYINPTKSPKIENVIGDLLLYALADALPHTLAYEYAPAYGLAIDLVRTLVRALARALAYAPADTPTYTTCTGREWRPASSVHFVPRGGDECSLTRTGI